MGCLLLPVCLPAPVQLLTQPPEIGPAGRASSPNFAQLGGKVEGRNGVCEIRLPGVQLGTV